MEELRRDLTEEEFNKWKDQQMKNIYQCPYFSCAQAFVRKVCGTTYLCGVLFDYKMYKEKKWIKVCDVKLAEDTQEKLPTKMCPSCTGSMCIKINHETGIPIGQSWCKIMNDYYERNNLKVDRHLQKYLLSWGVYLIPLIGEAAYLELIKDPELVEKILNLKK